MHLRFAAACLSLPALLLTACGGGDSQDGSSPASSSAATSSATASTASSARSSTSAASSSTASAASASSASSASASSVSSSTSSAASQSSSSSAIFTVSPASLTLTESTSTAAFYLAGENMAYEIAGAARCYALGGSSQTVISGDNTTTWASAGTSLADQKQIASYAEAAVQTIKARLGLTAATVGMDGSRVRICADSGLTIGDGSAGYRSFIVATLSSPLNGKTQSARDELTADDNSGLKRLVLHEMTHVAQAQLLKCQSSSPAFERWYLEGMALRVAGQDQPYVAELASLQTAFNSSTPTPFDDTNNTANANFDRYMAYRLAVDTLLGETGRNESDLFGFLRQYGQQNGCPSGGTGNFLNAFDSYFGSSLRESGSTLGGRFWADAAPRYALP